MRAACHAARVFLDTGTLFDTRSELRIDSTQKAPTLPNRSSLPKHCILPLCCVYLPSHSFVDCAAILFRSYGFFRFSGSHTIRQCATNMNTHTCRRLAKPACFEQSVCIAKPVFAHPILTGRRSPQRCGTTAIVDIVVTRFVCVHYCVLFVL